jgi:hypothetical protein
MSSSLDPKLIADGLRFLAAGFEQAARSGLTGRLTVLASGADPSVRSVRAGCNVERASFGNFGVDLPHEFLVRAIGAGESTLVLEGEHAKGGASFHGPVQDGSETYRIKRAEWTYHDCDAEAFALCVDIELGEPIASTFVHHAPQNMAGIIYRGEVEVPFHALFDYISPTTKSHASALRERLLEAFGFEITVPAFTVNA